MTKDSDPSQDETAALLPRDAPNEQQDAYRRTTSKAGYAYMVISTIGFGSMVLLLRVAESDLNLSAPRAMLLRTGVQALLSGCILLCLHLYQFLSARTSTRARPVAEAPASSQPLTLPRGALRWLLVRGGFGAIALLLHTSSLARIPVGDATAIFYTVPVFTMLFSYVLIGEGVSRVDVIAAALSLLGAAMVGSPGRETGDVTTGDRVAGSLMTLGASILSGVTYTVVRKLGSSIHFLYAVLALGACGVPVAVVAGGGFDVWSAVVHAPRDADEATFRLAVLTGIASACCGFIGQCALSRGLQLSKAGRAILIRNVDVPFVYAVSVALLGEIPTLIRAAGACIIVGSALVMALQKVE